jgi:hypothetical protein
MGHPRGSPIDLGVTDRTIVEPDGYPVTMAFDETLPKEMLVDIEPIRPDSHGWKVTENRSARICPPSSQRGSSQNEDQPGGWNR